MEFPLVWAEVDLEAIAHNVRELRRITDPGAHLMAVVKANAYGHGVVEVTQKALESGADSLGVARIEEGIELRKAGVNESVLIFIKPPSLDELRIRLKKRGTDDQASIERRLVTAVTELEKSNKYDYIIVNDNLEIAYNELKKALSKEKII